MLRHAHLRPNYSGWKHVAYIVDVYDGCNRWAYARCFSTRKEARTFVRRVARQALATLRAKIFPGFPCPKEVQS